jgi:hypothetical protein
VQALSFKNTALFKRGVWLSAAAVVACVAAPLLLNGSLGANPLPNLLGVGILTLFLVYGLFKGRFHRLADEVIDCEDRLKVRRGRTEVVILLSNIVKADVASGGGIQRIALSLREPTTLGRQIEFLPQASLWSNPAAVRRVAMSLMDRANQTHSAGARK